MDPALGLPASKVLDTFKSLPTWLLVGLSISRPLSRSSARRPSPQSVSTAAAGSQSQTRPRNSLSSVIGPSSASVRRICSRRSNGTGRSRWARTRSRFDRTGSASGPTEAGFPVRFRSFITRPFPVPGVRSRRRS